MFYFHAAACRRIIGFTRRFTRALDGLEAQKQAMEKEKPADFALVAIKSKKKSIVVIDTIDFRSNSSTDTHMRWMTG